MSERQNLMLAVKYTFEFCVGAARGLLWALLFWALLTGMSMVNKREQPMSNPFYPTHTTENVPDGRCHEDMPCWDCKTMGNHICGRQ